MVTGQTYVFDTAQARVVIELMYTLRDEMKSQLTALDTNVTNLVGTDWIAPGANIFKQQYDEWSQKIRMDIEKLTEYSNSLMSELLEWENAAGNVNLTSN